MLVQRKENATLITNIISNENQRGQNHKKYLVKHTHKDIM